MTLLPPIPAPHSSRCPGCNGAVRKGEEVYEIDGAFWHPECIPPEDDAE